MDREDQYDSETDQSDMEEEDRKESTRTNLGRIRLILQYVYDKPKLIRARDLQNEREMEHKKRELRAVNHQIDVMERPFGYFKNARGLQPRVYGRWEWFLYPKEWEHRAAGALYRRNKANRSCWWVVFVATTVVYFLLRCSAASMRLTSSTYRSWALWRTTTCAWCSRPPSCSATCG